ncbi:MAG: pyridoxamine 5'-phosphate oxidase family protein [Verrucomicrobiota bacterium]|nr:pyridoxamine 5'-phosphate oxidase family protein [Verrucomicrobiota bacterium]
MNKGIVLAVLLPVLAGMGEEVKSYVLLKDGADKQDVFLQDVAAFLEKAGHFYLATVGEDGGARVRPIKYTLIIDNKLIFATSNTKELFQHIAKNPKVEVSNTLPDGSAFLRYKGTAKLTDDEAVKARFLSAFPKFKDMYKDGLTFFFIEPELAGIFPMKGGKPQTKQF